MQDVYAASGRQQRAHWFVRVVRAFFRLLVPVAAFVVTLDAAWELRMSAITALDGVFAPIGRPDLYPSTWLTWGHAMVPVIFLLTNLVNRRYGQDYAIAHILASWAVTAIIAMAVIYRVDPRLPVADTLPDLRIAGAFAATCIVGQLFGAFVFDRTRGVVWWHAPLYSALVSTFISVGLFYPAAYVGGDPIWINHMALDAGVKATMSFLLLIPYFILRPIIRPLPGFGGY